MNTFTKAQEAQIRKALDRLMHVGTAHIALADCTFDVNFWRMAMLGEIEALKHLHQDMAKAFAAAQALTAIQDSLPDELREKAASVMSAEMTKLGFPPVEQTAGKE